LELVRYLDQSFSEISVEKVNHRLFNLGMGAHTVGTHRMADIHSMEEECKECKEWVEWVEWAVDNTGSHS
jgi:hypothetical protein